MFEVIAFGCQQRCRLRLVPARTGGAGEKARPAGGGVQVIPLSRANNISIMLTQFAGFKRGPQDIRRALVTGSKALGTERLSLLLQAGCLNRLQCCQALQMTQNVDDSGLGGRDPCNDAASKAAQAPRYWAESPRYLTLP